MIAHGRKQISEMVYARKASEGGGAVRLTNMIRGGAVVFGDLEPSWLNWLKPATKQAILGAFGVVDGTAVIKATNAYLTALAATDPTKATALAGFINEDPMMVCSLGLEPQGVTMPRRYCVTDGLACFTLPYKVNQSSHVTAEYCNFTLSADIQYGGTPFGSSASWKSKAFECMLPVNSYTGCRFVYNNTDYQFTKTVPLNKLLKVDANGRSWKWENLDDIETLYDNTFSAGTFESPNDLGIFTNYRGSWPTGAQGELGIRVLQVEELYKLVPCNHKVNGILTAGMLDMVNMEWYGNANSSGSFTIEYTLPDGTPWTPSNQTP